MDTVSASCRSIIESNATTHFKRTRSTSQFFVIDEAEKRVQALYCWMKLCGMPIDAAQPKRLTEVCDTGLKAWQWPAETQQGAELARQLNTSKPNAHGSTKRIYHLTLYFPSEQASLQVARQVVVKKYTTTFLRRVAYLENDCGDEALERDYQFYQMMAFWTDAAFMEFLRGMPGIPTLHGAAYDPESDYERVPMLMSEHLGTVMLDSDAYTSLARFHARELALSIMRMFQSLCDGGAFQMDQSGDQYMATKRTSDGQVDVWMVDSPFFLVGPVTKYQR
eukprot:5517085-Pleurochrysis_carterae.AAC.1